VRDGSERLFEELQAREDVLRGVDVERGSVGGGEPGERDGVAVERAMEVGERAGIGNRVGLRAR